MKRLIAALVTMAIVASCGGSTPAATSAPATAAAATAQASAAPSAAPAPKVLTLGYIADQTGALAYAAIPMVNAAKLAIDEINKAGTAGANVQIKLVEQDGATDPATSINVFNQMIQKQEVSGLFCCASSGVAGALKPLVTQAKIPTVAVAAVLPGLNTPPYLFRTTTLDSDPGGGNDQMAIATINAFKPKTVVIGTTADNQGVVAEAKQFETTIKAAGVQVLATVSGNTNDTDWSGPATQVINLKPDMFVSAMLSNTGAFMIKALRDRGYKGPIIANKSIQSQDLYKLAGKAFDGVIFPVGFSPITTVNTIAEKFLASYRAQYKTDPDVFAAQGYAAAYFWASAIKAANGAYDRESLAQAFAKVPSVESPFGTLTFKNGQAYSDKTTLLQWTADGQLKPWKP